MNQHSFKYLASACLMMSLFACSPTQTTSPASIPGTSSSATVIPSRPNASTANPTDVPSDTGPSPLKLMVRADTSLQGFALLQARGLCLKDLQKVETRLNLPVAIPDETARLLKAQGVNVEGQTLVLTRDLSTFAELVTGLSFELPVLPVGELQATTAFLTRNGGLLGSLQYTIMASSTGKREVSIVLKPVVGASGPCPTLQAHVSGGNVTQTQGGVIQGDSQVPVSPSAVPSSGSSAEPTADPSPTAPGTSAKPLSPRQFQIVRRDATSLTVNWEIAETSPHAYRLLLDGKEIVAGLTGTSYTFSGLQADKSYRLEIQALIGDQSSDLISLVGNTLVQGSTGTGGFGNGGGGNSSTSQLTPTLALLTPTIGPVGTSVTLTGTNFNSVPTNNIVKFGNTVATVTAATASSLTFTVPAGLPAGSSQVTVSINGQTSNALSFSILVPPAITSLSLLAGPVTGGTVLTITGSDFSDATGVHFGTLPATSFTVNSPTSIMATAPAQAAGLVDVKVTTPGGINTNTVADNFTYQPAPTITSLSTSTLATAGGTSVTITGTHFTGVTAVNFGNLAASSITVNSATSITATAPAQAAGAVDVRVTTPGGISANTVVDDAVYLAPPAITSLTPNTGSAAGGTSVTITGTGFTGATGVNFDTTAATSIMVNSATSITATAPAHAVGVVDVQVVSPGGTSANTVADNFTYTAVLSNVFPGSFSTREVIFANNQFVASTDSFLMWTSADGVNWATQFSSHMNAQAGLTFGNNLYVVVGAAGTIMTSPDGVTWTARVSGTTVALNGVAYGNNQYVAVGDTGTVLTSPDGVTWTTRTSGTSAAFQNITYGNNQYVAVGLNGELRTSSDGITWTAQASGTTSNLFDVIYGHNQYVAVGNGVIQTSPDAITWTARTPGTTSILQGISYGNSKFVVVGQSGTVLTSANGETWTVQPSGTTNNLVGIAFGAGKFAIVSNAGSFFNTIGL